jgi:chromosome segregation ATPase
LNRRSEELSRRIAKVAKEREEAETKAEEARTFLVQRALQLTDLRNARGQIEADREREAARLKELQTSLAAVQEELSRQRETLNRGLRGCDLLVGLHQVPAVHRRAGSPRGRSGQVISVNRS